MSEKMKNDILSRKLDDAELEAVSGGKASGKGNCDATYYAEPCDATVEKGSFCWGTDYCDGVYVNYTQPGGCTTFSKDDWLDAHVDSTLGLFK